MNLLLMNVFILNIKVQPATRVQKVVQVSGAIQMH